MHLISRIQLMKFTLNKGKENPFVNLLSKLQH